MKLTKEELEQRREWLKQNIEPLQSKLNEVEDELKKLKEAELKKLKEAKFDFKKLMPVGSVWLGCLEVDQVFQEWIPKFQPNRITSHRRDAKSIYYAHQIVKAAVHYIVSDGDGWHDLNKAVCEAEEHGVLQNLE